MRYLILGGTEARDAEGRPVALGGARLRALLAALALRADRATFVPAERLIDEIWAEEPPGDARAALQALVGRLRRALGHGRVLSGPGGYRLRVAAPEEEVDLFRFRRLAAAGERAAAAGDHAAAAAHLRAALALWRGPALADLPGRGRAAARPEAERFAALRHRLAADLARGPAEALLPELAELAAAHPLDEPIRALHLRALRAAGRPAEALAAYAAARHTLAERLGTEPGRELRALHAELLAAPAEQEPPPGRVGNLRPRLTSFVGRARELAALRADLGQARLITLTGPGGSGKTRLAEHAAAAAAAAYPDGVWLAELAPLDHPAAVPGAVLAALGRRDTTVLTGAQDHSGLTGRLLDHCSGRRLLLLLDNCEHLVAAAATLAETLLTHCPRLTVLATSREPLGVPGELVRPVEPLPPGPAHRLFAERGTAARRDFDPALDAPAVAEICRRLDGLPLAIELAAARLRSLTPRQIADRLDDRFRLLTSGSRTVLPRQQTLRAVVDWSWDLLSPPERTVLRRLSVFQGGCTLGAAERVCADGESVRREDVLGLLAALVDKSLLVAVQPTPGPSPGPPHPGAGSPEAHRAQEAHGPAEANGREANGANGARGESRAPGAHHRSTTRETRPAAPGRPPAAPAVRPGAPPSGPGDAVALEEAREEFRPAPGTEGGPGAGAGADSGADSGVRYRMLETIHEYAAARAAAEAAELAATRRRHTEQILAFLDHAAPRLRTAGQLRWFARIEADLDNIRAALRRSLDEADLDTASRLILSLGWFWFLRNHREEAVSWIEGALALDPEAALDHAPFGEHDPSPTGPAYLRRLELRLLAYFLRQETGREEREPSLGPLTSYARRVTAAFGRSPVPQSVRFPGLLWPFTALISGGYPAGLREMDRAVARCRELGGPWELAVLLLFRTHLRFDVPGAAAAAGTVEDAAADLPELERLARHVGDRWLSCEVHGVRAATEIARGDFDVARREFEEAIRVAEEIGADAEVPFFTVRMAEVAFYADDLDRAEKLLERALGDAERLGSQDVLSIAHLTGAAIALDRGALARARALRALALRHAKRATPPPTLEVACGALTARLLAAEDGDPRQAVTEARDALHAALTTGCSAALISSVTLAAATAARHAGRKEEAARLLGAALAPRSAASLTAPERREIATLRRDTADAPAAAARSLDPEGGLALLDSLLDALPPAGPARQERTPRARP
ncbi:BTAD domain-containing putative transcriptional regulator [Streptomyces hoynatensis]|uniref:BTAD domain-containing putative transcriptional regulator n=1 Tax=Streptomyces hoynatensis TaxID=1141874 RepID=UPI001F4E7FAC|nr:BTAD domain-containing putative transcriptional regulator [Streptomyces hoynatensis]